MSVFGAGTQFDVSLQYQVPVLDGRSVLSIPAVLRCWGDVKTVEGIPGRRECSSSQQRLYRAVLSDIGKL